MGFSKLLVWRSQNPPTYIQGQTPSCLEGPMILRAGEKSLVKLSSFDFLNNKVLQPHPKDQQAFCPWKIGPPSPKRKGSLDPKHHFSGTIWPSWVLGSETFEHGAVDSWAKGGEMHVLQVDLSNVEMGTVQWEIHLPGASSLSSGGALHWWLEGSGGAERHEWFHSFSWLPQKSKIDTKKGHLKGHTLSRSPPFPNFRHFGALQPLVFGGCKI